MSDRKTPDLILPRRRFLQGLGSAAIILPFASNRALAEPKGSEIFTLGVASGDPDRNSVILWTRVAPDPLADDAGNGNRSFIPVRWNVATDPAMRQIVAGGETLALAENGYNVRILVDGLPEDSFLYYQFRTMGVRSTVGRTRTFPRPAVDPGQMRFALTSCQDYQNGFYNAWRDIVEQEDLDFVMQVGDYIYEYGGSTAAIRSHVGPETETIEQYRQRYAQYRLDEHLRAAHAAYPFLVTWDDHEVDNNYARFVPEDDQTTRQLLERRRQAYRAYFEVMPVRKGVETFLDDAMAETFPASRRLFRRLDFGRLASIKVLDTRQYRDDQPCGDGLQFCPEAAAPQRTMLGEAQEEWLIRQLQGSRARWRVVEQQVMFMQWDLGALAGAQGFFNVDAWDGYSAQRDRISAVLGDLADSNNIVLTGDIHSSWAADLKRDYSDQSSQTVGAEFVCAGISSGFGDENAAAVAATLPSNPHIRYFDGLKRGYALHTVTNTGWLCDFRLVEDNRIDGSPVDTASSWLVLDGMPGVMPA